MESSTLAIAALAKRFRAVRIDPYRVIAWLGGAALLLLYFAADDDVGITMDEKVEASYGRRILTWYSSGFRDGRAVVTSAQSQYGGLYAAVVGAIVHWLPFDEYATRHFCSGACGVLGIAATWRIASVLGGPRAGLCASALLTLTPAWTGHALFNPKDIPFGAAAAWALFATLRIAAGSVPPRLRDCLLCGVASGAALGVRPGGMFMLAYPVLVVAVRLWLARSQTADPIALALRSSLRLAAGLCLAWLTMLIAWPWALMSPLLRPFQAASLAANFRWNGSVLFRGARIDVNALPRDYLPTWFAITLPESYLFAAACALVLAWIALRRPSNDIDQVPWLALMVLICAAFAPLAMAVLTQPVVYDAHRHFLFLLPPMAAVCGYALSEFFVTPALPQRLRVAALGAWLGLSMPTASDMLAMHPYQYSYFNRLAGGLKAAASQFETDYWGASYEEGSAWVVANLRPPDARPLRIASCHDVEALVHYLARSPHAAERFQVVKDQTKADVFLSTTRNDCHKTPGRVLHTVQRMGVPLLYVLKPDHHEAP